MFLLRALGAPPSAAGYKQISCQLRHPALTMSNPRPCQRHTREQLESYGGLSPEAIDGTTDVFELQNETCQPANGDQEGLSQLARRCIVSPTFSKLA